MGKRPVKRAVEDAGTLDRAHWPNEAYLSSDRLRIRPGCCGRSHYSVILRIQGSPLGQPRRSCYFQGRQLNPNKLTVRRLHQSFAECQGRRSRTCARASAVPQKPTIHYLKSITSSVPIPHLTLAARSYRRSIRMNGGACEPGAAEANRPRCLAKALQVKRAAEAQKLRAARRRRDSLHGSRHWRYVQTAHRAASRRQIRMRGLR
jgi:hypothetical protein